MDLKKGLPNTTEGTKDQDEEKAWWKQPLHYLGMIISSKIWVPGVIGIVLGGLITYLFLLEQPWFSGMMLEPLVANAVRATVAAQPTPQPTIIGGGVHTVTQEVRVVVTEVVTQVVTEVIQVTPTADDRVLRIESIPMEVISYAGGNDPNVQGWGAMSIGYDQDGEVNYSLNYNIPPADQGFTWAGIAMLFRQPTNIMDYQEIEFTIGFSGDNTCEVKFLDKAKNGVYFRLGDSAISKTGVNVTSDGKWQTYRIALAENFDSVNLTAITEVSFVTSSNLNTGKFSYTVSRIRFLK